MQTKPRIAIFRLTSFMSMCEGSNDPEDVTARHLSYERWGRPCINLDLRAVMRKSLFGAKGA